MKLGLMMRCMGTNTLQNNHREEKKKVELEIEATSWWLEGLVRMNTL